VPVHELADVIQGLIDGMMSMGALEPEVVNIDGCKRLIRNDDTENDRTPLINCGYRHE
jgi:hypothetical protein